MATDAAISGDPARIAKAENPARLLTPAQRMADAIRALANAAAGPAGTQYRHLPLAMADVATLLWSRFHKFDAADPLWPDRDRFVISGSDGGMLLYALLHLTGHAGMTIGDIENFGRPDSPAAAMPQYGAHPAIETEAGPPGQGLAAATGMAIAERNMASRFGRSLVDHRTWAIVSGSDLMDGISHEAAAIAGRLCLEKLAVLLDASAGAAGGGGAPADDVAKRFAAYGWATKRVDRSDHGQIAAALSFAARARKPTLIVCSAVTETPLQWDEPPFVIPPDPRQRWLAAGTRGASSRRAWLKRLARHAQRGEFERLAAGRLPDNWHLAAADLRQGLATDRPKQGTLACSVHCLEGLIPAIPELTPGLPGPEAAMGLPAIEAGNYGGRILDFGAAAHGMAGVANGMALHGGMIPVIATEAGSADRLRPALRMAAVMRKRVIYLLTDGGAEHLASLRAIPNVCVFRPSGPAETAECWELALRRSDGPSVLVLSAQPVPEWRLSSAENRCAKGGYVLAEADGPRQATLVATGPEVAAAMEARDQLAEGGVGVAVVSLPCWALFAQQYPAYRDQVLGSAPRIGVEAGSSFGWDRWLGADGSFIGMQGFGLPPAYRGPDGPFAIAPAAAAAAVMRRLG